MEKFTWKCVKALFLKYIFLVYKTLHCQSTDRIRIRWKFSGSDQKGPVPDPQTLIKTYSQLYSHTCREPPFFSPDLVESLRKVQKDTNTFLTQVIASRAQGSDDAANADLDVDDDDEGDDDDDNDDIDGSLTKEPVEKIAKLAW